MLCHYWLIHQVLEYQLIIPLQVHGVAPVSRHYSTDALINTVRCQVQVGR